MSRIVQPQIYRVSFLLIALVLSFLLFPAVKGSRGRVTALDWVLIALDDRGTRLAARRFRPVRLSRRRTRRSIDLICGTPDDSGRARSNAPHGRAGSCPCRRSSSSSTRYYGPLLDSIGLGLFAHRGYPLDRLVGSLYMTLEGIFGVPLDVAATYIVLFTIYGAVLQYLRRGTFFLDWAMAASGRSRQRRRRRAAR